MARPFRDAAPVQVLALPRPAAVPRGRWPSLGMQFWNSHVRSEILLRIWSGFMPVNYPPLQRETGWLADTGSNDK